MVPAAMSKAILPLLLVSCCRCQVQKSLVWSQLPCPKQFCPCCWCPVVDAKSRSPWYGPIRPQVPESLGGCQPHLKGQLPGDYGFDPLGLAKEPAALAKYQEAELLHARYKRNGSLVCVGLGGGG